MSSIAGPKGGISTKQRKTNDYTLTRVRNNQRRHRQRRREYVNSLEENLEETRLRLDQARAEIARLNAELDRQKSMNVTATNLVKSKEPYAPSPKLQSSGESIFSALLVSEARTTTSTVEGPKEPPINDGLGSSFLSSAELDTQTVTLATAVASNMAQFLPSTTWPHVTDLSALSLTPSDRPTPPAVVVDLPPSLSHPSPPPCCLPADAQSRATNADAPLLCSTTPIFLDLPLPSGACETYPPSHQGESTTLCSQACILIMQQNLRGLSATTIWAWLNHGFRQPKGSGEGCRVENGLLFGLLDFISTSSG